MGNPRRVTDIKFEAAKERCNALQSEIRKLKTRQWSSPAGVKVLTKFLTDSNSALLQFFEKEAQNPDLDLLSPLEQELRVHRACRLVPFLFEHLGMLTGADINLSTAEIVQPLRRFLRKILPNSEIILRAGAELNYSIIEVADDIRQLFTETPFADVPDCLPDALYVITVPPMEANDVLLHPLLAHEAGHGIYKQKALEDTILPKVEIPHEMIKSWAARMALEAQKEDAEPGKTIKFPFQEIELRTLLTESVTGTISYWVTELCCDGLALAMMGPAYFFAFVHFFSTVTMLDGSSGSHPPPRLRIRFMCRYLRKSFAFTDTAEIDDFIKAWETVADDTGPSSGGLDSSLALKALSDEVLKLILDVANDAIPEEMRYSMKNWSTNLEKMVPLLAENVPAIEIRHTQGPDCLVPGIAEVLNSGWYVRLADFEKFRNNIGGRTGTSTLASQRQLHRVLLKCLELAEVRRRWSEARDGLRGSRNAS